MAKTDQMREVTNEALFCGPIVSIRGKENNGSITLACPIVVRTRKSGSPENNVRVNYPVLSFNKDTTTENILEVFKRGDHIIAKCRVQSYMRLDENTGDTREIMNIYINEILPDSSKMMSMFCKDGRTYQDPKNEVYLSGTIAGITKRTERILQIRLDLSGEKRNFMDAMYYRAPSGLASELVIGSQVDVLAMVQTIDTKENKKSRSYQELVILDISK